MALSIQSNMASKSIQNQLGRTNNHLSVALERLGSGLRINSAKDDAAGLQIANRLNAQVRGQEAAIYNANNANSMLQTAEGAFEEMTNIAFRMKELATQGANGTNNTSEYTAMGAEFDALSAELTNIMTNTSYGSGTTLLDAAGKFSAAVTFQIGSSAAETLEVDIAADLTAVTGAIGGFAAMRALSTRNDDPTAASRPWDKDRDGFVLGEGAGVMVLEEYEHAKARGAKIYAELGGYGMSADAGHMTAPSMDGPRRAMINAMRNAGVNADQIDYLNAHGTSTPLGDINETNAIKAALGDHAYKTVVSSTKSMTGHLLGGAGGIESVFTVLALHHQKVPPTINLFNPDPECDLDYCANTARDLQIDVALKNNFGFGGTNGSLVFKRI